MFFFIKKRIKLQFLHSLFQTIVSDPNAISESPQPTNLFCCVCSKKFKKMLFLLVHMSHNHHPLHCDICRHTCANLKIMAKHKYDVHNVQSYYEDSDDETDSLQNDDQYSNLPALPIKVMYDEDTWVDCGLCTELFCNIKSLKNHRETFHKEAKMKIDTNYKAHNRNVPIKNECSSNINNSVEVDTSTFLQEVTYNFPNEMYTDSIDVKSSSNRSSKTDKRTGFNCTLCMHPFLHKKHFLRHPHLAHNPTYPFVCEICSRRYKEYDRLTRHIDAVHVNQLYKCKECGIIFPTKHAVNSHCDRDHNKHRERYECKICFKDFHTLVNFKSHTNNLHNDSIETIEKFESILTCNLCLKTFNTLEALKSHRILLADSNEHCQVLKSTTNNVYSKIQPKLFKCDICLKKFKLYEFFKKHLVHVHIEQKFRCKQCDHMLLHQVALDKHNRENHDLYDCHKCKHTFSGLINLNRHTSDCHLSLYRCTICLLQLKNQRSFAHHLRVHNKQFECDICAKKYITKLDVYEHMLSAHIKAKTFLCDMCSKQFDTKKLLKNHMKCHKERELVYCSVCAKPFLRKENLNRHMLRHNNKRFYCTKCSASYAQPYALKVHMLAHDGILLNKCDACHRSFQTSNLLKKHKHECGSSASIIYRCDLCPELTMRSRRELRQHNTLSHTAEQIRNRKAACEVCKVMIKKYNMKKHMLIHTGEKPYSCNICANRFVQKIQLDSHVFVHTRESKHMCNICERKFPRAIDLNRHLKSHAKGNVRSFKKGPRTEMG